MAFDAWQSGIVSLHTYDTYRFPDEAQPSAKAHVLGAAAGRPQSYDVLDAEEKDQADFHPEQRLVGEIAVLIDC